MKRRDTKIKKANQEDIWRAVCVKIIALFYGSGWACVIGVAYSDCL